MKRFLSILAVAAVLNVDALGQTSDFIKVDDQEGYCRDLAYRGAEAEWAKGYHDKDLHKYWAAYNAWYDLCMTS